MIDRGCDKCRSHEAGLGCQWVDPAIGRTAGVRDCECRAARRLDVRLSRIRKQLPPAFQNGNLERNPLALLPGNVMGWLKAYADDPARYVAEGRGLWFGGESGSGKTAAACFIVEQARAASVAAEFWYVPELLMRLDRIRHDESYETFSHEESFYETIEQVPLLVLDDVSATKTTPRAIEQLSILLNGRYNRNHHQATVVTTHFDQGELIRMFGAQGVPIVRRLRDLTSAKPIDFGAEAAAA